MPVEAMLGQSTHAGSAPPHFVISKTVSKENLYFQKQLGQDDRIMVKGWLCGSTANEKEPEELRTRYWWRKIQQCSNAVTYPVTASLASGESCLEQVKEIFAVKLCDRGWIKILKSSKNPPGFNLDTNIEQAIEQQNEGQVSTKTLLYTFFFVLSNEI